MKDRLFNYLFLSKNIKVIEIIIYQYVENITVFIFLTFNNIFFINLLKIFEELIIHIGIPCSIYNYRNFVFTIDIY